jgi:MFS transporter, SP family, general alpha glucoside:H+ symporter
LFNIDIVNSAKQIRSNDTAEIGRRLIMATSSDEKVAMAKPHPSEELEFVTISPVGANRSDLGSFNRSSSTNTITQVETRVNNCLSNVEFNRRLSSSNGIFQSLANDTRAATEAEHKMTFLEAAKLYPKAMGWSILLSLTIVMEGYDTALINSFYAFPEFRKSYGQPTANGGMHEIPTAWQSALTNGAVVGSILGLLFAGQLTERVGYKKTMVIALTSMSLFIFLSFFAFNIQMLMASQCLCGLSWGVFQTLSTTYAAEVMPVALRAYLTSSVNLCWLIGQLVSVGVIRGLVNNTSEWSYRIPFGLQWAWSIPILVGVLFAPESPWWLIRHEKPEKAKRSLLRLASKNGVNFNADETVAMMQHTNAIEKSLSAGLSYRDCFKNTDLRRTEIACMVWITQALCGAAMTGYAAYFYVQAGFSTTRAFDLSTGMYALAIIAGMASWVAMSRLGRRTLYLAGCGMCFTTLIVAGTVGSLKESSAQSWALGSLIILFTAIYDFTIGPVCYALVAEIPSTRMRVKTVVLARVAYNVCSIITNILMPQMLNPTAWAWKGKSCFLWSGTCGLCWIWCYFRLPEPKGLTYMELDILFEKRATARQFRKFQVHLAETGYFSLSTTDKTRGPQGWRGIS